MAPDAMTQLTLPNLPPSNWVMWGTRGKPAGVNHGARSPNAGGGASLLNETSWMTWSSGGGPSGVGGWLASGTVLNPACASTSGPGLEAGACLGGATTHATPSVRLAMTIVEMPNLASERPETDGAFICSRTPCSPVGTAPSLRRCADFLRASRA